MGGAQPRDLGGERTTQSRMLRTAGEEGTVQVAAADSSSSKEPGRGGELTDEVAVLRVELAERDRELLVAATSRRRTAEQSERTAAALRAKLVELEAVLVAA